jgi:outer membrane protein insertion porin family
VLKIIPNPIWSTQSVLIVLLFSIAVMLPGLLGQAGFAQAPPKLKVESIAIKHVGPAAVSDEFVKANIRTKVGEEYSPVTIDEDIRALFATGFFNNIQVSPPEIQGDGVTLTYILQGKPIVSNIVFEGNKKLNRKKLLKKISTKATEPLDERKLFMDTREIESAYEKVGYHGTKVEYASSIDSQSGKGEVVFTITESPKVKIQEVSFPGATAFKQKRLRKVIKTRKRWFMSWITGSGVLKEEQFEDDKEALREFYREKGYIDFEIKGVEFIYPKPRKMIVKFTVFEGQQYKVGGVKIEGNEIFSQDQIFPQIRMNVGATFTPSGLLDDYKSVEDLYGTDGYIDTRIRVQRTPNTETGSMDLVYRIEEGDQSYIEKIEIRGNTKTRDEVIRRELTVAPGEIFDMVEVERGRGRLLVTRYFEKVETNPSDTDVPDRKDLIIDIEEGSTGRAEIGAGFSSIENLVGFIGYTESNFDLFNPPYFRGDGQKFQARASVGTESQDYLLRFEEPWFLDRKLKLATDLFHREFQFVSDDYDERRTGARLNFTKALWTDFLRGSVGYTIENVGIIDVEDDASPVIKAEEGNTLVSKITDSLVYEDLRISDKESRLVDGGYRVGLFNEVAGGPLGADADFYKFEFRSSVYFKGFSAIDRLDWKGHVLQVIARTGVVDDYGNSDRVPLFDRWFLGGQRTLRGFDFREVGPKDSTGEPIGGNTYVFGSIEYSIPIISMLRFAVFYDIGTINVDSYDFGVNDYNSNFGFGVRLNIPRLGPLQLDYGIPLEADDHNDSSGKFQFGVSGFRDF